MPTKIAVEETFGDFRIERIKPTEDGKLSVKAGHFDITADIEGNANVMRRVKTPCGNLVKWIGRFKDDKVLFTKEAAEKFIYAEFTLKEGKPYMDFTLTPKKEVLTEIRVKVGKDWLVGMDGMELIVKKKDELHGKTAFVGNVEQLVPYKDEILEAASLQKDVLNLFKNPRAKE
ncbi:MAG: hypothetical protein Sv326_0911 [Candidatus Fermentimicrarchaeum limneticum]|uniref:Uncharacterized protein n=1 Tax=Fermentimicrarchaeum limneticum TaxID=2795018 RepID=A0A7D5XLW3_FERL1|nr:MAG: hypothetical protein Sv326_0911 [Candidatus Fermentimicrarchaeum limneticum]